MVEMLVDLNVDAVDPSVVSDTDTVGDTDAAAAAGDPAILAFYRFIDARRRYNRLPATARIDDAGGVEAAWHAYDQADLAMRDAPIATTRGGAPRSAI